MKDCCHDCPNRHPYCHAACDRYREYQEQNEAVNSARREWLGKFDTTYSHRAAVMEKKISRHMKPGREM